MGNDEGKISQEQYDALFQSTFPRGERHVIVPCVATHKYFNPRSRVGNDVGMFNGLSATGVFQSTFPRGERL